MPDGLPVLQACIFGFLGGLISDLVIGHSYREKGMPDKMKTWSYWLWGLVMWIIGAILVYGHTTLGATINFFIAVNIGASAPALFRGRRIQYGPNVD